MICPASPPGRGGSQPPARSRRTGHAPAAGRGRARAFRRCGWEHGEHGDLIDLRRQHPVECPCVDPPDTSAVLKVMLEGQICAAPPNNGEGLSPKAAAGCKRTFWLTSPPVRSTVD